MGVGELDSWNRVCEGGGRGVGGKVKGGGEKRREEEEERKNHTS